MPDDFDPTRLTDEQILLVVQEAGRRNAKLRKRHDRACEMCGVRLQDVVMKRRYCSDACRVRATYYRNKDAQKDPTAPFKALLGGKGWQQKRPQRRKAP